MYRHCLLPLALSLAPALTAQRFAEVEPNNTAATAQPVTLGTQVDCNLTAGEADWFRFTTTGGNVRMCISGTIDSQLELWDATATTQLAFSDDVRGGGTLQSDLTLNLGPGTYLCRVDGFNGAIAGPYSIDFAVLPARAFTAVEAEPNDSRATAQPIANGAQINASLSATQFVPIVTASTSVSVLSASAYTLTSGSWLKVPQPGNLITVSGFANAANNGMRLVTAATGNSISVNTIAPWAPLAGEPGGQPVSIDAGDEDWYQVVLPTLSSVWFQVTEGENTCIPRSRYEIYDQAGAPLVATTMGPNTGDGTFYNFRQSVLRVWPAGTYYFVVKQSNLTGAGNTTMSPFANYRLELQVQPMATGPNVTERAEPNHGLATATPLLPGQVGTGNITVSTGADPSDWWGPFTMNGPGVITYQTTDGATQALLDSTINLREDGTGDILISTTGGNILPLATGLHARATTMSPLPLRFYLEVVSPGVVATQGGNYLLQVSSIDPAPFVSASYVVVPVNSACGPAPRPELSTQFGNELPILGTTFSRSVGVTAPATPLFLLYGLSNLTANRGAVPLPYDMTPLGAPNCTVDVDPVASLLFVAPASGVTIMDQRTAPVLALRGLPVYEQCAVLVLTANALGIQMSNYGRQICGDRSY